MDEGHIYMDGRVENTGTLNVMRVRRRQPDDDVPLTTLTQHFTGRWLRGCCALLARGIPVQLGRRARSFDADFVKFVLVGVRTPLPLNRSNI